MLKTLNSPMLYLICGGIIAFVGVTCLIFMIRAYRAGLAIGLDVKKMKRAVTSSMTFSLLPSLGILLGVIALSGSLGTPWPWLRLSVIGALHYETQVAKAAAEATGIGSLSAEAMTAEAFATIALLMSICIMWGMVLNLFFNKKYSGRLQKRSSSDMSSQQPDATVEQPDASVQQPKGGFADTAMTAMFIGLISAYVGSFIGDFVSKPSRFSFGGNVTPIVVTVTAAAAMALFQYLSEKKGWQWLDSFSIAASMLIGMVVAIIL